jgi:hypothetical protein
VLCHCDYFVHTHHMKWNTLLKCIWPFNSSEQYDDTVQWMPDDDTDVCLTCQARFTFTHRRHHCRACGGIFCADCLVPDKVIDWRCKDGCRSRRQPTIGLQIDADFESKEEFEDTILQDCLDTGVTVYNLSPSQNINTSLGKMNNGEVLNLIDEKEFERSEEFEEDGPHSAVHAVDTDEPETNSAKTSVNAAEDDSNQFADDTLGNIGGESQNDGDAFSEIHSNMAKTVDRTEAESAAPTLVLIDGEVKIILADSEAELKDTNASQTNDSVSCSDGEVKEVKTVECDVESPDYTYQKDEADSSKVKNEADSPFLDDEFNGKMEAEFETENVGGNPERELVQKKMARTSDESEIQPSSSGFKDMNRNSHNLSADEDNSQIIHSTPKRAIKKSKSDRVIGNSGTAQKWSKKKFGKCASMTQQNKRNGSKWVKKSTTESLAIREVNQDTLPEPNSDKFSLDLIPVSVESLTTADLNLDNKGEELQSGASVSTELDLNTAAAVKFEIEDRVEADSASSKLVMMDTEVGIIHTDPEVELKD